MGGGGKGGGGKGKSGIAIALTLLETEDDAARAQERADRYSAFASQYDEFVSELA